MIEDRQIAELTAKALKIMAAGTALSCALTVAIAVFLLFLLYTARALLWLLSIGAA